MHENNDVIVEVSDVMFDPTTMAPAEEVEKVSDCGRGRGGKGSVWGGRRVARGEGA